MTRNRRNNMEITADILKIAKNGAKRTHIVYKANLNFKLLSEYLEELEKNGLIENQKEGENIIKTTDKGIKFLNYYYGFRQFVKTVIP